MLTGDDGATQRWNICLMWNKNIEINPHLSMIYDIR
jgi:hypothetical protein